MIIARLLALWYYGYMNFKENPQTKKIDMQGLADLGYPKDIRLNMSEETAKEIIEKQISYQTYQENSKQENPKDKFLTEEFKARYKAAYEDLGMQFKIVNESENPVSKQRLQDVLALSGNCQEISEIDEFIEKNKDFISDEEIAMLEMRKEWINL